jgi:hypothetical protein
MDYRATFGRWVHQQIANTRWQLLGFAILIASGGYSTALCRIALIAAPTEACLRGQCELDSVINHAFYAAAVHLAVSFLLVARGRFPWRFALLLLPLCLGLLLMRAATSASERYV